MSPQLQICSRCVYDTTIAETVFDDEPPTDMAIRAVLHGRMAAIRGE